MKKFEFIHLGHSKLTKEKFKEVKNRKEGITTKPNGGLWACRYTDNKDYTCAWEEWCFAENYYIERLKEGVLFNLKPEAKIYTIDSYEDLTKLMKNYSKNNVMEELFNTEEILSFFASLILGEEISLDFEKISQDYDAIELTEKGLHETQFSGFYNLYGWDVPSILIMNFDVVAEQEPIILKEDTGN